jgi:hypothetical protein
MPLDLRQVSTIVPAVPGLTLARLASRSGRTAVLSSLPRIVRLAVMYNFCRFHGARRRAPKGDSNGAWKHGRYSHGTKVERLHKVAAKGRRKPSEALV